MMEAVWRTVPEHCRSIVQVSTESIMGCGWGVCEGCVIPASDGSYLKCCSDGPVFEGGAIDWEKWMEVVCG
jgi:dihydroorotate dehydrogenase electron transfer subunit